MASEIIDGLFSNVFRRAVKKMLLDDKTIGNENSCKDMRTSETGMY